MEKNLAPFTLLIIVMLTFGCGGGNMPAPGENAQPDAQGEGGAENGAAGEKAECTRVSQCDDGNPDTVDRCVSGKCGNTAKEACVGDGESIQAGTEIGCCLGLLRIAPRVPGSEEVKGYCTSKCGNRFCDNETESQHNCPSDCTAISSGICETNGDCDDGNPCTLNTCSGTPKACSSSAVTECRGGDYCCPAECTSAQDYDCPIEAERSCAQQNGYECLAGQDCPTEFIPASDTSACCLTACVFIN